MLATNLGALASAARTEEGRRVQVLAEARLAGLLGSYAGCSLMDPGRPRPPTADEGACDAQICGRMLSARAWRTDT